MNEIIGRLFSDEWNNVNEMHMNEFLMNEMFITLSSTYSFSNNHFKSLLFSIKFGENNHNSLEKNRCLASGNTYFIF
jgi:hypothetical protein